MTLLELGQHQVHARGPAPRLSPLLERCRSGHGAWLFLEYIEVVFEIENLFAVSVITRMRGHPLAIAFNLNLCRPDVCRDTQPRP